MRKIIIPVLLVLLTAFNAWGQQAGDRIQREVRLYNPYRPSLTEAAKKNFFPDMTDTASVNQEFNYSVNPEAFTPPYTVSPIRPAAILPDPLPKLYKSYLNLGIGNYFTPFGEVSIASERSRKGMLAFYASHFSSNGNIELDNLKKVYAGYMDNDAVIYGKKFLRRSVLSGSADFSQMTRHAYGYDTLYTTWEAEREDVRLNFMKAGGMAAITSLRSDSGSLSYDFRMGYDFFRQSADLWQHDIKFTFDAGKTVKALSPKGSARRKGIADFYGSLTGGYDLTIFNEAIDDKPRHLVTINPALGKKSGEWNFNLGVVAVTETRTFAATPVNEYKTRLHVYPDVSLGIAIIPSFLVLDLALEGNLSSNSATETVLINPFILTDGSLYRIPFTDNEIIARAAFTGSVIPSTTYRIDGSYTVFRDMLFFSNVTWSDMIFAEGVGNFFAPVLSDGNVANIGAEVNSSVGTRVTARLRGDYYSYTLTDIQFPYNMPAFDGSLQVKYNLRDKIIAGAGLNAIGKRTAHVSIKSGVMPPPVTFREVELPGHVNINLSAEYRYSKILSFWVRMNNIALNRHYEWAFYPSQRFMMMAGFSYSL
ncbi:MAG: hypothetical protein IH591_00100 [Bacteroidales bacterium]|nr:hypothetical protein [Bacteroidales bacterium]